MLVLGFLVSGIRFHPRDYLTMGSFLMLYALFMTTFYLLYGISKKRLGKLLPKDTDMLHLIAIFLSAFIILFNAPVIFILIILSLLGYMLFVGYSDWKKTKKKSLPQFYLVYFLLIIFSVLNIIDILIPNFFGAIQTAIYVISISLFLTILYKVLKILNVESNGRKKK